MVPKIHPLTIDFHVTPAIKRYVIVYLIEGEACYLIDSGVDGAEETIEAYLHHIGRKLSDIKGIFLTHAHPDHIGSAAKLKERTGCKVYASLGERPWIEDIQQQFEERPIPNFYTLVNRSVSVDTLLKDGDRVVLEPALTIQAVGTPGHSRDELSYLLPEQHAVFTGDAIPVRGDIPIWVHRDDARRSLETLRNLPGIEAFYPAWDAPYDRPQAMNKLSDALELMEELQHWVDQCRAHTNALDDLVKHVCDGMKTPHFLQNPLFRRTIQSMLSPDCPCKRLDCERHGICAACQAHHHGKDHLTCCEKLKKKEQRRTDKEKRRLR